MKVKELPHYEGRAKKPEGNGCVQYHLWLNSDGKIYIRITGNDNNGTYSKSLLFPVSEYAPKRTETISKPRGFHLEEKK